MFTLTELYSAHWNISKAALSPYLESYVAGGACTYYKKKNDICC